MVQRGLPDQWWDCAMECKCHLRDVHDKMADGKTAYEKIWFKFDGLWIPFGANVSCKPISSMDEARLRPLGKKDASRSLHEIYITCGRRMVRRFARRGVRRPRERVGIRYARPTVQARSRSRGKAVFSMCRRISQFTLDAAKRLLVVNPEQDENE